VDQRGGTDYPRGDADGGEETSLGLDAVSSAWTDRTILLMESDNSSVNMYAAVDQTAQLGATYVELLGRGPGPRAGAGHHRTDGVRRSHALMATPGAATRFQAGVQAGRRGWLESSAGSAGSAGSVGNGHGDGSRRLSSRRDPWDA
jgi:hypothetical protein